MYDELKNTTEPVDNNFETRVNAESSYCYMQYTENPIWIEDISGEN